MERKEKNIDDVIRNIILNADWIEWPDDKANIAVPEVEGDPGNGYWYVCSECHGYLKWKQNPCPGCGWEVDWNG